MGEIPIFLATGNQNKAERVIGSGIAITHPFFDEEPIKNRIDQKLGWRYPVEISRMKLREQLEKEGEGKIVIVSDSVIAVEQNDDLIPVNRDNDPNFIDKINNGLRKGQPVYFLGAASFGIHGEASYTLLTYFKIKPGNRRVQIPINIGKIPDYYPNFEFGIVDGAGKFVPFGEDNFFQGRPYISGLTPELISLAKEYGDILPLITSLRDQISGFPFNTIVFYELISQGWTYDQIVTNWENIFQQHGGNCSLHSLYFATRARKLGFDPKIAIFPSQSPDHEFGHSAVLIGSYLFDPGLSLPSPIIFNFQPIEFFNGKSVFLNKDGLNVFKNAKKFFFSLKKFVTIEDYLSMLPSILSDIHGKRSIAKKDSHDQYGRVIFRQSIQLKQ